MPPVASTTAGRLEDDEPAGLPPVAEGAGDAVAVLEQAGDRALHEHVDARCDGVVLERADHLQAGAVADVGQPGVAVAAEVALEDPAVRRAVEQGAPLLELEHPLGRLLGVDLGHPPVVDSSLPPRIVSRKWTCQLSSGYTLPSAAAMPPSAITVWALPSSDLQTSAVRAPWRGRLDRRPQPGAAGADDDDVERRGSRSRPSEEPQVVDRAGGDESDVQVGQRRRRTG